MSEPISPDDSAVGTAERLHPLFLLTGLGGSLRGLAGGYAAVGYLAVSGQLRTALVAALALVAMLGVGVFLHWRRFEYRIGAAEVRIDSGILSRTHRSIPFDRIHDVDITQGPLARLFGIARVKFETGGSGGKGDDEGVLQAIPVARAEAIRRLVRERRSEATSAVTDEPGQPEAPAVYAMALPRVLLAGLFNFSLALFAGLFGLTQTVGDVMGFDPLSRNFWRETLSAGSPLAAYLLEHRVVAIAAGLLVLVLAGIATGMVRTLLRDFRFRLDRTAAGLRRRRGLLTKTDVSLPARRAQAAILAGGPVREAFGWAEVRLQSLAADEGGKGDHVLAPLATVGEAAEVLGALGWEPVPATVDWQRVSRAHVATLAVGLAPLLVIGAVQIVFSAAGVIPWIVYAGAVATRWLSWRRTGWSRDDDRLLMRSGWWRRRIVILPLSRIQSADYVESAVSRAFGTASLLFGVAGGSGFSAHRIPALRRETARELRAALLGLPQ